MTNKQLIKRYNTIGPILSKICDKLVGMGCGHMTPSELRKSHYNLKIVQDYLTLVDERDALHSEAETRHGPGLAVVDQLVWKAE